MEFGMAWPFLVSNLLCMLAGYVLVTVAAIRATRGHLAAHPEDIGISFRQLLLRVGRRIWTRAWRRCRPSPSDSSAKHDAEQSIPEGLRALGWPDRVLASNAVFAPTMPRNAAPQIESGDLPDRPSYEDVPARIAAHDHMAAELIKRHGDFDTAQTVNQLRLRLQHEFAGSVGLDTTRVLFLNDQWVCAIGHMSLLDALAKMSRLGLNQA